jgi:hypothetical protein
MVLTFGRVKAIEPRAAALPALLDCSLDIVCRFLPETKGFLDLSTRYESGANLPQLSYQSYEKEYGVVIKLPKTA